MNKLLVLLLIGLWTGLVLGLSFIEAPLKFQAPGITTELGLGIGRLVFGTLNKIEICLTIILVILYCNVIDKLDAIHMGLGFMVILIVLTQSFYLLPTLDARAISRMAGEVVRPSSHHLAFVIMELVKLFSLVFLFVKVYKLPI